MYLIEKQERELQEACSCLVVGKLQEKGNG